MPIRRVFLGLDAPALQAAARWLFDTYAADGVADFDRLTLVVPGGRAGRRLLDLLLTEAESRGMAMLPPKIVTAGTLPEELYEPQRPLADNLTQQLAWCAALQSVRPQVLAPLIPHPPEPDDLEGWLPLADMLKRLHGELAADALNFSDVAERATSISGFNERQRWHVLENLQRIYLQTIDAAGLWDQQTARLVAIEHHELRAQGDLVLLGTVDINQALRKMLDQVAGHVTALVFAPQDWADRFDEHGCLLPSAWQDLHLPITEQQIRVADDPVDQADAVARVIAEYGGRYRGDELIIGVPDEKIVPQISRQLHQCGLPARWGPGRPLTESAPYRLLAAVAEYVAQQRFHPFAALVRHPDVEQYLTVCGVGEDYLIQLDEYYCDHLPARLGEKWLGKESHHDHAKSAYEKLARLLEPLAGAARRPDQWAEPLLEVLREVYRGREFYRENVHDAMTQKSLETIRTAAMGLRAVPHTIAPKVSAAIAIGWVLSQAAGDALPPPPDAAAIELLGWLELPWDDGPALIVTSFNEGFVPEPTGADPFLPNRLRAELGLWDNARRYARDAYYLTVLCATRRDLTLIVGRRDADGGPLAPSRLLFAAPAETAARRALRLFAEPGDRQKRPPLPGMLQAGRQRSGFQVQRPLPLPPTVDAEGEAATPLPGQSMRVTEFRDYLACPYRYYLRHILKLEGVSDDATELDGGAFGGLLHDVLAPLKEPDLAGELSAEKIEAFLLDNLRKELRIRYGKQGLAPLEIQFAQLRHRLSALAKWQAGWAAQGWRVTHTEIDADPATALLLVDGSNVRLRGRIDRIDVNERSGEIAVLDYKSSGTVHKPGQTHRRGDGAWIDLQLPLYRHLLQGLNLHGPIRLGYIAVPNDVTAVGVLLADWDETALSEADEAARNVVRNIRQHNFWPPRDPGPNVPPDFAAICLEGVFDAQWEEAKEECGVWNAECGMQGEQPLSTTSELHNAAPTLTDGEPFRLDESPPTPKKPRRARKGASS
ncbi:MAG: PD-(D/E)XK nuclease family protein [Planctomycetes bacterium]|nr:PD-(D/E)XK nuclease family protein [Planctomycetota bacterium]